MSSDLYEADTLCWDLPTACLNGLKQLTHLPGSDFSPLWSPDREYIAFLSDDQFGEQIYLVDTNGGTVRRLTNGPADVRHFNFSPDGGQIIYVVDALSGSDVYLLDVATGAVQPFLVNPGIQFASLPMWRP